MRRGTLPRAFQCTALMENEDGSLLRRLVEFLRYNGCTLVTKPAKESTDSQGRFKENKKGIWTSSLR